MSASQMRHKCVIKNLQICLQFLTFATILRNNEQLPDNLAVMMNKPIYIIATCICTFLLASCSGDEKEKMLGQLAELERQNLAYESMTNDTLAKELVGYFEHHGTSNERMRAHYMLGCTYRDMGESPLAVLSFQDAIAQADTTATDCDLRTLCSIYSQLGWMFHGQLLLTDEIAARSRSQHFAEKLGNMWIAISEK